MKHLILSSRLLAIAIVMSATLCACTSKGSLNTHPSFEQPRDPTDHSATQPPTGHAHTQRYWDILGSDYCQLENTRISLDGNVYVYHSPTGITGYTEMVELGTLTYSQTLAENLSTDSPELDSGSLYFLQEGLSHGMLEVTREDPETGNHWDALYILEGRTYPQEYEYVDNEDGSIQITKYRGTETNVSVPAMIDGKPVTKISGPLEGAFSNCPTVVSVTIPEGVTLLNDNTFYGCIRLKTVRLPASLSGIGHCAFNMCPALTELYFEGDAPAHGNHLFDFPCDSVTIYHPENATGWDTEPWTNCALN